MEPPGIPNYVGAIINISFRTRYDSLHTARFTYPPSFPPPPPPPKKKSFLQPPSLPSLPFPSNLFLTKLDSSLSLNRSTLPLYNVDPQEKAGSRGGGIGGASK